MRDLRFVAESDVERPYLSTEDKWLGPQGLVLFMESGPEASVYGVGSEAIECMGNKSRRMDTLLGVVVDDAP